MRKMTPVARPRRQPLRDRKLTPGSRAIDRKKEITSSTSRVRTARTMW